MAGIVSGHPGLRLDVEGHTDNVGSDDYNQQLSEQRGSAVRDYLTQQGGLQSSVPPKASEKLSPWPPMIPPQAGNRIGASNS